MSNDDRWAGRVCWDCGAKSGILPVHWWAPPVEQEYFGHVRHRPAYTRSIARCWDRDACELRQRRARDRARQRGGLILVYEAPNPSREPGRCSWCSEPLANPDGAPLRGRARCYPDREGRDCHGEALHARVWNARDALRVLAEHEGRTALACVDCGLVVAESRVFRPAANGRRQIVRWTDVVDVPWEADHEVPLEDGGDHALANLRVRCVGCHRAKTGREASARAARRSPRPGRA